MIGRVVLLTDRAQLALGRGLVRTVAECAAAGLETVVVREHDLAPSLRSALIEALARIDSLTVISSRIVEAAAHGTHLAAHQTPAGTGAWGRSCHAPEEVRSAADQGAAWATLSPYAASASKPSDRALLSPEAYAGHPIPVLALAGVEVGNAARAVASGAHGVAVMGAVMRSHDPARTISALLREVQ